MKQLGVDCLRRSYDSSPPVRLDRRTISAKQAAQKAAGRRNTNESQVGPNASDQSLQVRSRSRGNTPMVFDERRPSFELAPFQSALDVVLRLRNRSSFSA